MSDELTPIKTVKPFKYLTKKKKPGIWVEGTELENIHWFGLREIMQRYGLQKANEVILQVRKHWEKKR